MPIVLLGLARNLKIMHVYGVLRQDRFHRTTVNPIVFAAPLLGAPEV
jgi:hypothetical protein